MEEGGGGEGREVGIIRVGLEGPARGADGVGPLNDESRVTTV